MNRSTCEPGPLAEVDCQPTGDRSTLVFVRDLRHPPEKVWAALTDPAQLSQWAPFTADRNLDSTGDDLDSTGDDPDGTGDVTLTMIDGDTTVAMPASVRRAEPPALLEYTWGSDVLRWELAATGAGTRLTLRHTVAGSDWVPKVAAGWHLCLVVAEHLLDGQPVGPIRGAQAMDYGWQELHDAYAAKLGIRGTGWPAG